MVLIGVRDSNVKNGKILNSKCPKCESTDSLNFSIYKRYTHITLIPLFAVGKFVNIQCSSCNDFFDYEEMSETGQIQLRNEKLKKSIWMFTGTILLTISLLYCLGSYISQKEESKILIKTPAKGDVYNLKFSNGFYSNMKIEKITEDSIYTIHNDFNAYMFYEVDDLDKPENYSERKVNYSKKDILALFEEGEIIKITRKSKSKF